MTVEPRRHRAILIGSRWVCACAPSIGSHRDQLGQHLCSSCSGYAVPRPEEAEHVRRARAAARQGRGENDKPTVPSVDPDA